MGAMPFRPVATLALALFIAATAGACRSQEPPVNPPPILSARDVMGFWSLAAAGAKPCRLSLQSQPAAGGFGVAVDPCGPPWSGATTWRPVAGGFELLDGSGALLARFTPDGVDAFDGTAADGSALRLERAAES